MSASTTTIPNPTFGGTAIVTVEIVNLPLTYYGPSIPLDSNWVYGGPASPASIYIPPSVTEIPPITTPAPPTSVGTTALPTATPSETMSMPETTSATESTQLSSTPQTTLPSSTASSATSAQSSLTSLSVTTTSMPSRSTLLPSVSVASSTPPATPPSGTHRQLSAGGIVAIVVGAVIASVFLGLLLFCCLRTRRGSRRSYPRTSPEDVEVEGASLLAGRLPGGESPPSQSPAMSTHTLNRPAAGRPTTPMSTRPISTRPWPISPVPVGVGGLDSNSPTMEPSRASTEEIHRRSELEALQAAGAQSRDLPSIAVHSPRSSISPRQRLVELLNPARASYASAALLGLLGLRNRSPQESLGEGWEQVSPPPSSAIGLGIHVPPPEPRYTTSPPEPFPPRSLGTSSGPSGNVERLNSTYTTVDKPKSTVSERTGQTEYVDARSRPATPLTGVEFGAAAAAAGVAGVAGVLLGSEMRQRDRTLVSQPSATSIRLVQAQPRITQRPSTPPSIPSPPPQSQRDPRSQPPLNPFDNQTYAAVPTTNPFDDDLDSPVPQGLLPPGLEGSRGVWTQSAIDEEPAGHEGEALLATLDDEPPRPVGAFSRGPTGTLYIPPIPMGSPSSRPSVTSSPFFGQEERDITGPDDDNESQAWSGQVRRARFVNVSPTTAVPSQVPWGEPSTTVTSPTAATATTARSPGTTTGHTIDTTTAPSTVPVSPIRTDIPQGAEDIAGEDENPLATIYEWFRQHPSALEGPGFVIPSRGDPSQLLNAPAAELGGSSGTGTAQSSLTRSDNDEERRRSLLRPTDQERRPYSS
ncbi:hypothetical protein FRB99_007279 [Tulasnella sp. 403]|nr:hypothetical protein FRB99_007279 [Tulasnella sp. 403]